MPLPNHALLRPFPVAAGSGVDGVSASALQTGGAHRVLRRRSKTAHRVRRRQPARRSRRTRTQRGGGRRIRLTTSQYNSRVYTRNKERRVGQTRRESRKLGKNKSRGGMFRFVPDAKVTGDPNVLSSTMTKEHWVTWLDSVSEETLTIDLTNCAGVKYANVRALANKCKQLKHIILNGCTEVSDDGMTALAENCPLKSIALIDCTKVTKDGVLNLLLKCNTLEKIIMSQQIAIPSSQNRTHIYGKSKFPELIQNLKMQDMQQMFTKAHTDEIELIGEVHVDDLSLGEYKIGNHVSNFGTEQQSGIIIGHLPDKDEYGDITGTGGFVVLSKKKRLE